MLCKTNTLLVFNMKTNIYIVALFEIISNIKILEFVTLTCNEFCMGDISHAF